MNFFEKFYQLYYKPKIFFQKKSYSMFGEDLFINNFFKKNKGLYLDIGCYHPIDGNNTYLLYKRGWKGINIDINQLSISLFKIKRPNDLNLRVAISNNKAKKIKFYSRKKINMLNTIDLKFAKKNFPNGFNTSYIKSDTLNNIIKKSKFKNHEIDFMNIDIEGNEYLSLKNFNFKKYKPKLLCVEIHHNKSKFKHKKVYKLMVKNNYKVVFKNEYSFIFKLKNLK
tara:strand:+ start:194 stop:868 length:675 start_codon:yes stop_codon:yes gene_type:complete